MESGECVFCNIVKGQEPAMIVHQSNVSTVFLAAMAVTEGHLLVIPNRHMVEVTDLEEPELADLMKSTKQVSQLLKDRLGAEGVNLLNASGKSAQQSVFHFHMHVVPRFSDDKLDMWFGKFDGYIDARNEEIFRKLS